MPDHEDSGQVDLGFLYKMLDTRDSSKRRVKPADPAFLCIPKVTSDQEVCSINWRQHMTTRIPTTSQKLILKTRMKLKASNNPKIHQNRRKRMLPKRSCQKKKFQKTKFQHQKAWKTMWSAFDFRMAIHVILFRSEQMLPKSRERVLATPKIRQRKGQKRPKSPLRPRSRPARSRREWQRVRPPGNRDIFSYFFSWLRNILLCAYFTKMKRSQSEI